MKSFLVSAILVALFLVSSGEERNFEGFRTGNPLNKPALKDSLCTHKIILRTDGKLLSWYQPETEGAGYGQVIELASEFIKNGVPREPETGMELYYLFCEFVGPEANADFYKGTTGRTDLPHNPACVFAGFTESLAVKYRVYSGDETYLEIVRKCLDHMLQYGTTPSDWKWSDCPYASSYPGKTTYYGTSFLEDGRGDGEYVLEPDKVGEMGYAYLQFYEITEEPVYLEAALNCAKALAQNIRSGSYGQSPWPNRVKAENDESLEDYGSNVLPCIKLFDEIIRISSRIEIDQNLFEAFNAARATAWKWLFSIEGPMKTYVWKGYFEDTPIDPENKNRVQITPLELARYLIEHPEYDPYYKEHVPALINWCKSVFGTDGSRGYNAQCEQLICYRPMGSHSARYASVCAMWHELSKEKWYRSEAFENFNWATYCTSKKGIVSVGTGWAGSWFSDGYGDYIKHFIDGMAAIPEWAPDGEDHWLSSTSVVQTIRYSPEEISYKTFLPSSTEKFKLTSKPKQVIVDGQVLRKTENLDSDGWTWEKLKNGGVLCIKHSKGREILIRK